LEFPVLSKDCDDALVSGYRFRELSITLDIYRWRGGAALRPAAEIVSDLIRQVARPAPIGIMLHHKVMADDAFSLVDLLLEVFGQSPMVRFHTFQSLLKAAPDEERTNG
jgi:hypothetical protein